MARRGAGGRTRRAASRACSVAAVDKKSPAAEVGLLPGDVVVAVDGVEVQRALDFQRAMLDRRPGDKVALIVLRKGKPLTLSLDLGRARPTPPSRRRALPGTCSGWS